uniref:Uncharacterized protein n=1 Tax=Panagrolaimus sp. ES5 TaxID=591445 RepID=A0AC34FRQ8_9BILA
MDPAAQPRQFIPSCPPILNVAILEEILVQVIRGPKRKYRIHDPEENARVIMNFILCQKHSFEIFIGVLQRYDMRFVYDGPAYFGIRNNLFFQFPARFNKKKGMGLAITLPVDHPLIKVILTWMQI